MNLEPLAVVIMHVLKANNSIQKKSLNENEENSGGEFRYKLIMKHNISLNISNFQNINEYKKSTITVI